MICLLDNLGDIISLSSELSDFVLKPVFTGHGPGVWECREMCMTSFGDKIVVFGKLVALCFLFRQVHYVFFFFNVVMCGGRERIKRESSMWCLADRKISESQLGKV